MPAETKIPLLKCFLNPCCLSKSNRSFVAKSSTPLYWTLLWVLPKQRVLSLTTKEERDCCSIPYCAFWSRGEWLFNYSLSLLQVYFGIQE